ncbi:hypothetical protein Pse7367_0735 [Thalassoporum mexicanum PCC 7367]|uniref:hypothetical protein n=1 Tax=Thalassoporum mexicanum TaxID=3457544 RepID=UPI00029FF557|nr:hypothetical protein [Pseudanabaena sp. PCC 7367]AFY69036.1 hypothetical protein Pse7367_0735 [Pseudanabaena sp. PCC 7367]
MQIKKYLIASLILGSFVLTNGCQSSKTAQPPTNAPQPVDQSASLQADPFKDAVEKAMQSANLVQIANTSEDWTKVSASWQQAIDLMKAVPESNPNYEVAQQKVVEYQPNLEYAKEKAESSPSANEYYNLSVFGKDLGDGRVQVDVQTNIPGTIETVIRIDLANQKSGDLYIGTNIRKLTVQNGTAQAIYDASALPKADYKVKVSFLPGIDSNKTLANEIGINESIKDESQLFLGGSRMSVESFAKRLEGQQWISSNVYSGYPWNPSEWLDRFGSWQEFPISRGNPDILKNFYFESIDMTVSVNVLKNEVVTFRDGKNGI